ncbi:hypothetical protein BJX70DRAFT_200646 [Aspergillus crustosus]
MTIDLAYALVSLLYSVGRAACLIDGPSYLWSLYTSPIRTVLTSLGAIFLIQDLIIHSKEPCPSNVHTAAQPRN